ncbi:MAG: alpha/beta hydrolase [Blastocatellia bacterium]
MRTQDNIDITAPDGQHIRGVYSHSGATAPLVIFAHGFGSTRHGEKAAALENECARRGWGFIGFDFRGHGASAGVMRELRAARLLEDMDLILARAATRSAGPVFLVGSSMGGWATAWTATRHPARIAACALIAPAFSFPELRQITPAARAACLRRGWMRFQNEYLDVEISAALLSDTAQFPPASLLGGFHTPCLIFHGMRDGIVPHGGSMDFVSRCAETDIELRLYKTGDHRLNEIRREIAAGACDFFAARMAVR